MNHLKIKCCLLELIQEVAVEHVCTKLIIKVNEEEETKERRVKEGMKMGCLIKDYHLVTLDRPKHVSKFLTSYLAINCFTTQLWWLQ